MLLAHGRQIPFRVFNLLPADQLIKLKTRKKSTLREVLYITLNWRIKTGLMKATRYQENNFNLEKFSTWDQEENNEIF